MGEFKSDAHYIYYGGQESLSRPHNQEKSLKCSIWVQSQKWQNDLCWFPRQIIQYHSILVYAQNTNNKKAEVVWFYEDVQILLELTPKKMPFSSEETGMQM